MTNSTASLFPPVAVVSIPAETNDATASGGGTMNRKAALTLTAMVLALMGYMVYNSMARVRKQCEVCIEFNGARRCARGAGADDKEARQGAQTAACGVLANGMDETIRCQNTRPVT